MTLYIKNEFNAKMINNLNVILPQAETLFVEFSIKDKAYIIGSIYRLPGGCLELFLSTLEDILCEVLNKHGTSKVFIMVDYNIDLQKFNMNKMYFTYFTMMISFGYRPTILRPTRATATSFTILDQICTKNYEKI